MGVVRNLTRDLGQNSRLLRSVAFAGAPKHLGEARAMKRLAVILLGFLALAGAVRAEAHRVALAIGNASYADPALTLANPVNDLDLMQRTLDELDFAVTGLVDADARAGRGADRRSPGNAPC